MHCFLMSSRSAWITIRIKWQQAINSGLGHVDKNMVYKYE